MLLKVQFGVGNLKSIRNGLSTEFFNTTFIMTSLNKLHSSVQKLFIQFLFVIECNRFRILNILAEWKNPVGNSYIPIIMNAYVSNEFYFCNVKKIEHYVSE